MAQPESTKVTDAGLANLEPLANLETLSLATTKITDAGLAHLAGLGKLSELDLSFTKTTAAGVKKFQAAHPECKITR